MAGCSNNDPVDLATASSSEPNVEQSDTNPDTDTDDDGTPNVNDAFPTDLSENTDTDDDGVGNNSDPDDEGDGIPDVDDLTPLGGDETDAPVLTITEPIEGSAIDVGELGTGTGHFLLAGSVSDESAFEVALRVNSEEFELPIDGEGNFETPVLAEPGAFEFQVVARDIEGNETIVQRAVSILEFGEEETLFSPAFRDVDLSSAGYSLDVAGMTLSSAALADLTEGDIVNLPGTADRPPTFVRLTEAVGDLWRIEGVGLFEVFTQLNLDVEFRED